MREGQKNEEEVDGEEPPFLHCAAEFIITGPGRPHVRISAVERKRAGSPSIRNHLGLHFSPIYLPTNIVRYSVYTLRNEENEISACRVGVGAHWHQLKQLLFCPTPTSKWGREKALFSLSFSSSSVFMVFPPSTSSLISFPVAPLLLTCLCFLSYPPPACYIL